MLSLGRKQPRKEAMDTALASAQNVCSSETTFHPPAHLAPAQATEYQGTKLDALTRRFGNYPGLGAPLEIRANPHNFHPLMIRADHIPRFCLGPRYHFYHHSSATG